MPQDNTLGAPTEGLGQTVTFAASGGRVPQTQAGQRQAIRNNASGGGAMLTARALQVPEAKPDPTFQVLAKLGGEVIKPHLEAERTAAFVQGMQKAATGQAITEIVDEQPWYSKIFGSTSLVDGARAYTASSKAASVAADMEAKMPELRKLSGEEFAKYATEQITVAATGDSVTDMMLSQQVSSTLPAVMKGQAKAHLRYQQEVFEEGILSNAEAQFALLGTVGAQSRSPNATKEDADLLGQAIKTLDVFDKPGDMQQEAHDKLLGQAAIKAIGGGNFDVYRLMQDSGKLANMEPQTAFHIQRAYEQASNRAKINVPDQLLVKVADFRTMAQRPDVADEDILAAANAIDEEYTKMTGDSASFVGNGATVQELMQLRAAKEARREKLLREHAAAATKEDKELAKIRLISELSTRVAVGDGKQPYLMLSETPKEQQEVFDHLRASASPDVQLRVRMEQAPVAIDKVEQGAIEAAIFTAKKAGDPSLLYKVYHEKYLPMVMAAGDNSLAVAEQYAGKYGEDMARYHALAHGQPVDATMQGVIYNEIVSPQAKPLTKSKRNDEIVAALTTGRIMSMFKGDSAIKDPEGYAAILQPRMKSYLSTEDAIADAKMQMPNLSLVGGYHWQRSTQSTDVQRWIAANRQAGGVAFDNLDQAMNIAVNKFSAEAGIESGVKLGQTVDTASGEPQLYIMGIGSDNQAKIKLFKAGDLHTVWKSGEGRLDKKDFIFGPEPKPLVDSDAPSIYASADEWRAYRELQAARKAQPK